MKDKRIIIIGGVAAGSSCATRARRLNESAKITIFERGPHVSFANCGLPYHLGDVIEDEEDLLLVSPEDFKSRYAIDVHTHHEVLEIDRIGQRIRVHDHVNNSAQWEAYDDLLIATGARAFAPPIPGLDHPGVFSLRTVPDTRRVREWIDSRRASRAVVIGGGFIGLETAENLHRRGIEVHVVEAQDQVLPPIDIPLAAQVESHLDEHGVHLHLSTMVQSIDLLEGGVLRVVGSGGLSLDTDLVIVAVGVRPRSSLAADAGLDIGSYGGILVDEFMRTSDPHIWSAGDVIETTNTITGEPIYMPLAGPANRQGRLAADSIMGRGRPFRGVQGTVVCGLFDLTVASTGLSRKHLEAQNTIEWDTVWLHPKNHVGYYPGAQFVHLEVNYAIHDGRILGAQAVGGAGTARRIDVISMAIQLKGSVYDLEEAELCYAPQYGSAKDAVNVTGMLAANRLRGDFQSTTWEEIDGHSGLLVDVREEHEFTEDHISGAVNLPLSQLRERLEEIPPHTRLNVYCQSGKRSYEAVRMLHQRGYEARSVLGGLMSAMR